MGNPIISRNLALFILLFPFCASADESRYVDSLGYSTAQGAAIIASKIARERSSDDGYEWGGGIFEYQGSFYYTEPATSEDPENLDVGIAIPVGGKLVAVYHSHTNTSIFSERDVAWSTRKNIPMYLISPKGRVEVFDPGVRARTRMVVQL